MELRRKSTAISFGYGYVTWTRLNCKELREIAGLALMNGAPRA
jgi:hypothetical protein